jgi:hypothetical protein
MKAPDWGESAKAARKPIGKRKGSKEKDKFQHAMSLQILPLRTNKPGVVDGGRIKTLFGVGLTVTL